MISGNTVGYGGGGLFCYNANPSIINCIISANTAYSGGGVYCGSASPRLTDCTVSKNSASYRGGAMYCEGTSSQPSIADSILWGDTPQEIYVYAGAAAVTYCDLQGGYAGTGNINLDPLFVDPDGPDNDPATWQDNDYRLAAGSPCIDAGQNSAVPADTFDLDGDGDTTEPIPFDLDGQPRFVDDPATVDCPYVPGTCGTAPIVDMGAYEYQPTAPLLGDLNCDGVVNVDDVVPFVLALVDPAGYQTAYPGCDLLRADMNGSGTADGADIQLFVDALLGG